MLNIPYYTKYYREHKDSIKHNQKKYYETSKIRRAVYDREKTQMYKTAIFIALGDKCCCCGHCDIRSLDIDHINNNGVEHRKVTRSPRYYYKSIWENLGNHQLLCKCCHWLKHQHNIIAFCEPCA